jgi:hypothetical protein
VRQAGKSGQAAADGLDRYAQRQRRSGGCRRVLCIVPPAQGRNAGEIGDASFLARAETHDPGAVNVVAAVEDRLRRNQVGGPSRPFPPLGRRSGIAIVHRDHRRIGIRHHTLLDGGVILHRAVAVEMIGRDVEQNADRRLQRGREIDLVGRHFDHMRAPGPGGFE